ncbi:TPA: adenylosuccinate lyase [archaeon]|nr:adenylosuccinate lyase [Candidatus Naiadarchaeales archaeon SRR2090153.bin461]HIK03028.1 adenylosuccinate lyase [Candidatus Naiadarchaeales archaeon SRR2090159.bin1288]
MAVHPIEYRYNTKEMLAIFQEENILQKRLDVEAALARAEAAAKLIPKNAAEEITKKADVKIVKLERVKEIEAQIDHDLMAIVKALTEKCSPEAGKFVHFGATSYDIVDTAWALILREALKLVKEDLVKFKKILLEKAENYKKLVMVGRTHGQHATPITLGLKFAVWAAEVQRHLERVEKAIEIVSVGKLTGAVGTGAALGKSSLKIQELLMKELGLGVPLATNQVLQRDRHAEAIISLSFIGQTLEKIAKEIRNLQRTEIGEVEEPFREKQVGSSTMPQKRNPHKSERICGIARVIKANAIVSLDNIPLEHERDLTDSSAERIILPESFILTHYILREAQNIISGLRVNEKNIRKNLKLTRGRIMGEALMQKLVEKGVPRQEAHELVRVAAMESFEKDIEMATALINSGKVKGLLSLKEIEDVLNPENYIGAAVEQIENVIKKLK